MVIKRFLTWSYLLMKRFFKNPIFACSLLLMVLFAVVLKTGSKDESIIKIGICVEDKEHNTLAKKYQDAFAEKSDHSISYTIYDNTDDLKEAVLKSDVISGFVFERNFEEKLSAYTDSLFGAKEGKSAIISVYYLDINKDSTFLTISYESVYDEIFSKVSEDILVSFVDSKHPMTSEDIEKLKEIRGKEDIDYNFFTFSYLKHAQNTGVDMSEKTSFMMIPLKGIILTLILLSSMCGGILIFNDKNNGFFSRIPLKKHIFIEYIYCLIPAVLASIVGIICLALAGIPLNVAADILRFILYVPLCALISLIFILITRNIVLYSTIIPFYLICNLLLCPVFLDFSADYPFIRYIRYFLPVHYGL